MLVYVPCMLKTTIYPVYKGVSSEIRVCCASILNLKFGLSGFASRFLCFQAPISMLSGPNIYDIAPQDHRFQKHVQIAFSPPLYGGDRGLENSGTSLFDVHQFSEECLFLPSHRHIIARLHVNEQFGVDTKGCFYHEGEIGCHRALPVQDLVQLGIWHVQHLREFLLRNAPCSQFLFQYITRMCRYSVHSFSSLLLVIASFTDLGTKVILSYIIHKFSEDYL